MRNAVFSWRRWGVSIIIATGDFWEILSCTEVKNTGLLDFASGLSYNFMYSENGIVLLLSLERVGCRKPKRSALPG